MNARGKVIISARVGCARCAKVVTTEAEVMPDCSVHVDLDSINYYYSAQGLACTNCHLKYMAEEKTNYGEWAGKNPP